jgi:hypothetical protein
MKKCACHGEYVDYLWSRMYCHVEGWKLRLHEGKYMPTHKVVEVEDLESGTF